MRLSWLAVGLTLSSSASANTVERIVAVIDDHPILLSELRERSIPEMGAPNAIESEVHRRVLEKIIVEQLVAKEAQRAHLFVTSNEIDNALAKKAADLGLTATKLASEARNQGFTDQGFRDEMQRQLLEGKLVQLRVASRVVVTEADARNAYVGWARSFEEKRPIDLAILSTFAPSPQLATITTLAPSAWICELGKQLLARDTFTCARRTVFETTLPPAMQGLFAGLGVRDATTIRFSSGEIDVFQLLGRLSAEPFEVVKERMMELGYGIALARERDAYIAQLRQRAYVNVRL